MATITTGYVDGVVSMHGRSFRLQPSTGQLVTRDAEDIQRSPVSLRRTHVVLDNDDITNINSSAITLVAAPGAGKVILPHYAVFWHDTYGSAYTGSNDVLFLQGVTQVLSPIDSAAFTATVAAAGRCGTVDTGGTGGYAQQNTALTLSQLSADFGGGGAGQTFHIDVFWELVDVTVT